MNKKDNRKMTKQSSLNFTSLFYLSFVFLLIQGFTLTLALNIQRIPNNEQPSESQPSEDIKAVANNTQSNSVTAANINTINLIASKTKKQKHTTTISTVNLNTQAPPEQVAKTESLELHTLLPAQNVAPFPKYKAFTARCNMNSNEIKLNLTFDSAFNGRIYANNYPDDKSCGTNTKDINSTAGITTELVSFNLPLGQCGIQMQTQEELGEVILRYDVILYIQYSAFVQQAADQKVAINCMEIMKPVVETNEVNQTLDDTTLHTLPPLAKKGGRVGLGPRQGRRLRAFSSSMLPVSQVGEALMEIINGKDPSPKSKQIVPVFVGEDVTLVVSTKVTRGYDARIVNCTVHDGSPNTNYDGSRSQQIIDSTGCSTDLNLVPNFRRRRLPVESRNKLITLHFTSFPAFKFPERDHLHVKCAVAYCHGPCPQEVCDSGNHYGSWKDKYGARIGGVLVGSMDVSNSLQVLAPNLEGAGSPGTGHRREPTGSAIMASPAPPPALYSRHRHFYETTGSGRSFPTLDTAASAEATNPQVRAESPAARYAQNGYTPAALYNSHNQQLAGQAMGIPNLSSVCISPGTLILVLVILGLVLVICASATLWLALRRNEKRKYYKHSSLVAAAAGGGLGTLRSYASSHSSHSGSSASGGGGVGTGAPSPLSAPYYRFSQW